MLEVWYLLVNAYIILWILLFSGSLPAIGNLYLSCHSSSGNCPIALVDSSNSVTIVQYIHGILYHNPYRLPQYYDHRAIAPLDIVPYLQWNSIDHWTMVHVENCWVYWWQHMMPIQNIHSISVDFNFSCRMPIVLSYNIHPSSCGTILSYRFSMRLTCSCCGLIVQS